MNKLDVMRKRFWKLVAWTTVLTVAFLAALVADAWIAAWGLGMVALTLFSVTSDAYDAYAGSKRWELRQAMLRHPAGKAL